MSNRFTFFNMVAEVIHYKCKIWPWVQKSELSYRILSVDFPMEIPTPSYILVFKGILFLYRSMIRKYLNKQNNIIYCILGTLMVKCYDIFSFVSESYVTGCLQDLARSAKYLFRLQKDGHVTKCYALKHQRKFHQCTNKAVCTYSTES